MKLTFFLSILTVFQLLATETYSQQTRLNLNFENIKISDVLKEIENKSEFFFLYSPKQIDVEKAITIIAKEKTIECIIDDIFDKKVKYEVHDRQIVLTPRDTTKAISLVQQKVVKGNVADAAGISLPGVSVVVKGTALGAITDSNGNFTLSIPPEARILSFSFIGMEAQEIMIGSTTEFKIIMRESAVGLDEVVVIGYGTMKKRDISTAISSVNSETLKDKPVSNFAQAISGNLAGVRISATNAAPGGGSQINIRGIGSINASTSPLIVIDGFPLKDGFDKYENPLNSINPSDIESIEVLKDASSSAIYGTQASNGVIIITTKSGKTGLPPTITINASSGFQNRINKVDVLNKQDYLRYFEDARIAAYLVEDPNFGTNDSEALLWQWTDPPALRIQNWALYSQNAVSMADPGSLHYRWITTVDSIANSPYDTDWQDATVRAGSVKDFQLTATGGTENIAYMVSGGYFDQEGIVPTTGYDRFSFRAKIDANVSKRFKIGLNLAPTFENLQVLNTALSDGTGAQPHLTNPLTVPMFACPVLPVFNEDGTPYALGAINLNSYKNWNLTALINPFHTYQKTDIRQTAKNLATFYAEINLTDHLSFRSEFHNEFRYWERNTYSPSTAATRNTLTDRTTGTNEMTTRFYWNLHNLLTYQNTFGNHNVTAMAGYSAEEAKYRSTYMLKYDFPVDQINTLNQAITVLNAQNDARTGRSSEALIGSFGRIMYNYSGRYYFTGTIRRDASSKFGKDHKWGIFPSVSLAWRVSDEPFFEPLKQYVNDWKIRGGWGNTGNSGIGNYNAISTLGALNYVLGNTSTVSSAYETNKVANSALGWETNTDWSIATDIHFLKDRISLSVDYFYRLTDDLLYRKPLPVITGFDSYLTNIAKMRNRGFEWVLTTHNMIRQLKWTTDFNLYYVRNRVLDITSPLSGDGTYTTENRPLANLWGPVDLGAFNDWEDVKTNPVFGSTTAKWMTRSYPGSPKIADVNGDGILDASDYTINGSAFPDFTWGMTNNFGYRNIDLSIQVNGTQGGDINMINYGTTAQGNGQTNVTYFYFDNYWTPDRTDGRYACPIRKGYDKSDVSGALIFKGSFVNVQFVTLGYTVPGQVLQRVKLKSARFYMNVQNAWLFTKFPGYNPEINSRGDDATSQGLDRGAYPLSRTVSFGINLTI